MSLSVEYLLVVSKPDEFCDSEEAFTRLLRLDSRIQFRAGKLSYDNRCDCDYLITKGEVAGKGQRFFHVRFCLNDETQIDAFSDLLRAVRGIMNKLGSIPETLWDDVSFFYARQAYEKLYRIENLMRKLIANFMLVTVGTEWLKEASPKEFTEAVEKSKRKQYSNILDTVDFSDLGAFLLKPYSSNKGNLFDELKRASSVDDLSALKQFVPESNWSRYFSSLVNCDDGYLKTRWEQLYELRCKIAHNATINKVEYERLDVLIGELSPKLTEAISKLPQVRVPQEEVEQIAENAARNVSVLIGDLIRGWQALERAIIRRATETGYETKTMREARDTLLQTGIFNVTQYEATAHLQKIRNDVIHPTGVEVSKPELASALLMIRELLSDLGALDDASVLSRTDGSPSFPEQVANWYAPSRRATFIAASEHPRVRAGRVMIGKLPPSAPTGAVEEKTAEENQEVPR